MDVGQMAFMATSAFDPERIGVYAKNQTKVHPSQPVVPHTKIGQLDCLFILPLLAAASILIFTLQFLVPRIYRFLSNKFSSRSKYEPIFEDDIPSPPQATYMPSQGLFTDFKKHLDSVGVVAWVFEFLKLLTITTLFALSIYATVVAHAPYTHSHLGKNNKTVHGHGNGSELVDGGVFARGMVEEDGLFEALKGKGKHGMGKKHKHRKGKKEKAQFDYVTQEWAEFGATLFYVYCLIGSLVLLCLKAGSPIRRILTVHSHIILFLAWCVFAYRDLYPLCTFPLTPVDILHAPAWLTWSRIGLLTLAAAVIPLFRPRKYVPIDPANPQEEANPEQTASWISILTYHFMEALIRKGWKSKSLAYEELPPMTDYDRASYLTQIHLDRLDPIRRKIKGLKPRGMFRGLMSCFWKEYILLANMLIITCLMDFSGPVALNRLLSYLESKGKGTFIKPWFWIMWLALGPFIRSMAFHFYIFTTTRLMVRSEALLSLLIFDHSLRVKMKDDVSDDDNEEKVIDAGVTTPAIIIEDSADAIHGRTAVESATNGDGSAGLAVPNANGNGVNGHGNGDAASTKGKKKDTSATPSIAPTAKAPEKEKEKEGSLAGRVNTLISSDVENVNEGRDFLWAILYAPAQIILAIVFLYQILGWCTFVGLAVMVATLPIPGFLAKAMNGSQKRLMKATDSRISTIGEILGALRMIKMFGNEEQAKAQIAVKREIELKELRNKQIISLFVDAANFTIPVLTTISVFWVYTKVQGGVLSAAKVFSALSVLDLLRDQLHMLTWQVTSVIAAKVSLDRISDFLTKTELLQIYDGIGPSKPSIAIGSEETNGQIIVKNATFVWSRDKAAKTAKATSTVASKDFSLHIDDLEFPKGQFTLIAGGTASGKTSLLMALLGEMDMVSTDLSSKSILPREGGVSYASEQAWVQSGTIRDNIVFNSPWDPKRYAKTLHQCCLEKDLELFSGGDMTEVGEKGLTLSGGQKARVSLARCVYSNSAIVMCDDVLAALDVGTSRWVVDKCLKGDLLRGRTVIMITHHVALVAPAADYVVRLEDGRVASHGPMETAMKSDIVLAEEVNADEEKVEAETKEVDGADTQVAVDEKKAEAGKLVMAEEKAEGRVDRTSILLFLKALSGSGPNAIIFWTVFPILMVANEIIFAGTPAWLGRWSNAYAHAENPQEVSVAFYLGVYIAIVALMQLIYISNTTIFIFAGLRASRRLHDDLVARILGAYLRFYDATPVGRITSRLSKDMRNVDQSIPRLFFTVVEMGLGLFFKIAFLIIIVPKFTPFAVFVAACGAFLGEMYIKVQLAVKREMSNSKSPVFSGLASYIEGAVSIRAYGAQEKFTKETQVKLDKYISCANSFYLLNRWISLRMDTLGGVFTASLAALLVYTSAIDPSLIGFSLSLGIAVGQSILWAVRVTNEAEVQGNAIERVVEYVRIENEPAPTEKGKPAAAWPTSGAIALEKLSAKYSADGPTVLDEVSIDIKSGERVGIVGRTGSGKSTTALALLRLIPTTGTVRIDGVDTKSINLDALRGAITIIPQDPTLLSGTLRYNLDPWDTCDDSELNDALRSSGLTMTGHSKDGASTPQSLTLESNISAGGSNLSQGQRQLVAIARALVRRSKIMLLDEATASVSHELDTIVQGAISSLHGVTILTIAHRLETIVTYDKIMVLGGGKLLEFDSPANLVKKEGGYFAKMISESGQVDKLKAMIYGEEGSDSAAEA